MCLIEKEGRCGQEILEHAKNITFCLFSSMCDCRMGGCLAV